MVSVTDHPGNRVSPDLMAATVATLRRLGPRQFNLTAVAEAAGVSRGTVHNALGTRDDALKAALDHLASDFIANIAAEVDKHTTLNEQAAAAAMLICAHRQRSDTAALSAVNDSILLLLLANIGADLMQRSIELWKPLVRTAQRRGEVGAGVDVARASEWIVRMLLSFELLPTIRVDLDKPRAVREFVAQFIVAGLADGPAT